VSENDRDKEANRLGARLTRYASVGTGLGTTLSRLAAGRLLAEKPDLKSEAKLFRETLGSLKGPLMKVAQLLSTIPDLLPPDYSVELSELQAQAPPMGAAFVRRRMSAELGADWQGKFRSFEQKAIAAASLGQVHKAAGLSGDPLACKLQYPDMDSAVEADLQQLRLLFRIHRQLDRTIDTQEIAKEIEARLREELDYEREAKHIRLYAEMLSDEPQIRVPKVFSELSTRRLLTMGWLEGERPLSFGEHPLEGRNFIATNLFKAWWQPFCRYGVIHGDPHLGNYTIFTERGAPRALNLLDYGCIRIFPARFVGGVVDLYRGLLKGDNAQIVHAYETWGFKGLTNDLIDTLNIWARFIYGPLMEDRVRAIADGVKAAEYGRKQAYMVHQALKTKGPVTVPREFVFMDRAAIGLGGVFIRLRAELNFHRLFNEALQGFAIARVEHAQKEALGRARLQWDEAPRLTGSS
jgi:predicted unusual protein kinase regulating ubiquinone biosynthesis (AarF/ABC1/UbiB family)